MTTRSHLSDSDIGSWVRRYRTGGTDVPAGAGEDDGSTQNEVVP